MTKLSKSLLEFVKKPNIGILATLRKDGSPHLTAVWYLYEKDEVWISITDGRMKYKHFSRDPRVSLAVAGVALPYKEVVFEGTAEISHEGGDDFFRRVAIYYYGDKDGNRYADYDSGAVKDKRLILHYRPTKIMAYDFEHEDDYHEPWGDTYQVSF